MTQENKINPFEKRSGRGADGNTSGRFESVHHEIDLNDYGWVDPEDKKTLKTKFYQDNSQSILSENDSPDLGFRYSMNFYRGCEHGCAYCYARPTHEYLGMSAGLDFETKIFVKEKAPELLRKKFLSPSWKASPIMVSGITDCYQPAEKRFQITRRCLQVISEFGNPVGLITKNHLITRDIDIFQELASRNLVWTTLSITSLDADLARELEPRTSTPQARLQAVEALAKAGIPVGINIAPVIPGLNDHEIPHILKAAAEAGAKSAGFVILRLPYSVKDVFSDWLDTHRPDAKDKILSRVRSLRDGRLYNTDFGQRMRGTGIHAENIKKIFNLFYQKYHLNAHEFEFSLSHFHRPTNQLSLFGTESGV